MILLLQAEIKRIRPPRINHSFVCVTCIYEPGKDDFNKSVIYKYGKLRILLEPISLTLFQCPKCKSQHVLAHEFRATLKERRNLRLKKRSQRIKRTKEFYH